jgi:glutamine cyclotransferase
MSRETHFLKRLAMLPAKYRSRPSPDTMRRIQKRKLFSRWQKTKIWRTALSAALLLSIPVFACQSTSFANLNASRKAATPIYGFEAVNTFPHDRSAFTQGLAFHDSNLLESTGKVGHSSLRRVELKTGKVQRKVDVHEPYFAEGITVLKGQIYQLTWRQSVGFIYDARTFKKLREFNYRGEGWGLTNDGQSLILSDGSNRISFLDPANFEVRRTITIVDGGTPVAELNELEYIQDEIYANVWHTDRIARIDPRTGAVVGWIELAGLLGHGEVSDGEAVLNGIAYDETNSRLFVTGKLWPKLFEIRLIRK